jgi:hypothetical protein
LIDTTSPIIDDDTVVDLASARARRRLTEAAELVEFIRMRRTPSLAGVQDGMPRAASKEPPAPLHVGALDESDQVYAELINWVEYWAEKLEVARQHLPLTMHVAWRNQDGPVGFRATATPPGAAALVQNLTTWLLIRHDQISTHPQSVTYFEEAARLVETAYSRFPLEARPARPHLRRPCMVCGEQAVTADWPLGAGPESVSVWCESCAHVVTPKSYRKVLEALA